MACLRARVLCLRVYVLACSRSLHASVLTCLRAWRVYVLSMLTCLVCLRAWLLRWNVLFSYVFAHLVCFFVLFALHFNTWILRLCALLSWTYFLFTFWYQLIKLFETNSRIAGKSIDISNSYGCSKAISIFYNLYIHLLH